MPKFWVKNAFFSRGLLPLDPDQGAAPLNHRPPWTPRPHSARGKSPLRRFSFAAPVSMSSIIEGRGEFRDFFDKKSPYEQ